jgi:hypothetical protein
MGTLAIAWLLSALVLTVLLPPKLGLRGLFWLWIHNGLCLLGAGHELWRAKRRKASSKIQGQAS